MMFVSVLLKIMLVWVLYQVLQGILDEKLQAFVMAWIVSYAAMVFSMMVLSPFHLLNRNGLLFMMASIALTTAIIAVRRKKCLKCELGLVVKQNERAYRISNWVSLVPILLVFIALVIRSLFYYDTTSDGLMQGMPKLAFIAQDSSLYTRYNTPSVNIFANECLGEMNALYYLLMMQSDHAILLGNAEVWLMSYFLFLFSIRVFGYQGKFAGWLAASCSLVYTVVGLALTIKTDLLATCMPTVAVAMLLNYFRNRTPGNLFSAIAVLGAMAASKISVVPFAGLLLLYLIYHYVFRTEKRFVRPVLAGGACFIVFCNRYVANILQYGNPFVRAANEKVTPSVANFISNLKGLLQGFTEGWFLWNNRTPYSQVNWAITRALGYLGMTVLVMISACFVIKMIALRHERVHPYAWPIISIFVLSLCFFMSSTAWYSWSYRYLAAYVMVVYAYSGAVVFSALQKVKRPWRSIATTAIAVSMISGLILNGFATFRLGQPIPLPLKEEKNIPRVLRKIQFSDYEKMDEWANEEELVYILNNGGNALLTMEFSIPFYMFFGTDHCVHIDMVGNEEELLQKYTTDYYDLVIVASACYDPQNYENLNELMEKEHYTRCNFSTNAVFISPNAMKRAKENSKSL